MERSDYQTLKKNMPDPKDRLDRIENVLVNGMPDINYCSGGVECWIEQKSPTEPKRSTTRLFGSNHKLSVDQCNWFLRQRTAGGIGWILIATDKRWILIDGAMADQVNDLTVDELIKISTWTTTKPVRDKRQWKELRKCMLENSRPPRIDTSLSA